MKRFGVIGSVNKDVITDACGTVHRGLGGVLYTAVALGRLTPGDQIWLLARIGTDVEERTRSLVRRSPGLRDEGILVVSRPNYRCELTYLGDGNKRERLFGQLPPLTWAEIAPFASRVDALLVNFITGQELELCTLQRLRQSVRGPVIMDLHSLLLRTSAGAQRVPWVPPGWRDWVAQADVLQMNEREAALLAGMDSVDENALAEFARQLLRCGPGFVMITRGARGAVAAVESGADAAILTEKASAGSPAVDTTGCGDAFLAATGLGVASLWPPERVLKVACKVAGAASRTRGPEGLETLSPALLD